MADLLERAVRTRATTAVIAMSGAGGPFAWSVPTLIRLGGISVPRRRLATLREGDGLVGCIAARQRLWLRHFRRHGADVRINQEGMQMLEGISVRDDADGDWDRPDAAPAPLDETQRGGPGLLEQLAHEPLNVHCSIDGPMLTLEAAARLASGDVLELPVALADARVSIRCLGRVIASGRLVGVGDRLAVLVTDVGAGHVQCQ